MSKKGVFRYFIASLILLIVIFSGCVNKTPAQTPGSTATLFQHVIIDSADVGADLKGVGDLNGDGYPDIIVADNSGTPLQWYEWPSWTKHIIDNRSVFTTDMQVASIIGDGILDIIIPDYINGQILWYENPVHTGDNPNGAWTMHVIGFSRAHDVEAGDVNGDGKIDVVVRPHDGKHILYLQNNPLSWTRINITTSTNGEGTALGDIDADGDLDILGNGYWLESPEDPTNPKWIMHTISNNWPTRIKNKVADINKDGRLDVLIANSESTGRLVWYEAPTNPGDAGATWIEHTIDHRSIMCMAFWSPISITMAIRTWHFPRCSSLPASVRAYIGILGTALPGL